MSDTDSFIREVTEEVRQDRMLRYWKRYGPWVAGGILAIVIATAVWSWMQAREREQARALGGAFLSGDPADPGRASALVERTEGPARVIARMQHASALAATGDREAAIEAYRSAAADSGATRAYADLASLEAARLEAPSLSPPEAVALVDPIANGDGPYRLLALELRAGLLLNAGDTAAAHEDLRAILSSPEVTGGLDARARQLLAATGGEATQPTN